MPECNFLSIYGNLVLHSVLHSKNMCLCGNLWKPNLTKRLTARFYVCTKVLAAEAKCLVTYVHIKRGLTSHQPADGARW